MTLATFIIAAGVMTAITEIIFFTRWRDSGRLSESAYPVLLLASIALPIALYVIFTYVVPDLGAMELF